MFYIVEEKTTGTYITYPGNSGRWERFGDALRSIEDVHYTLELIENRKGYLKDGAGNYYQYNP